MEHLEDIHFGRFYRDLMDNAAFLFERIKGESADGVYKTYYDFDDCEWEAENDGVTLSSTGYDYYYKEGKVYECVIYFKNKECTGINRYSEPHEIKDFVKGLLEKYDGYEDDVLENRPWTEKYLIEIKKEADVGAEASKSIEPALQTDMKFTGNFGTLNLTIESDGNAMGQYYTKTQKPWDGGTLAGDFKNGEFIGEWRNKGMEGLINFTVADDKLNGVWKEGLDKGAMRGKWEGTLLNNI